MGMKIDGKPLLNGGLQSIISILMPNQRFITGKIINNDDYQKYISFIDSHTNESKQKVDEYLEKIDENSQDINESEHREDESSNKQFDNSSDLIEEDISDVDISIIKTSKNGFDLNDKEKMTLIDNYISTNNVVDLMNYLNNNCSNEEISLIFDKCYYESYDMHLNLCKEGISYHNAVAHHKYANSLILELRNQELKNDLNFRFRESINHLKKSINR